ELEDGFLHAGALEATNELARLGVLEELTHLVLVERAEGTAFVEGGVEMATLRALRFERVDRENRTRTAPRGTCKIHLNAERAGELVGDRQPATGELGEMIDGGDL